MIDELVEMIPNEGNTYLQCTSLYSDVKRKNDKNIVTGIPRKIIVF